MAQVSCTKRAFYSKSEAKKWLQAAKGSAARNRAECRYYRCDGPKGCGMFHLTSMTLEEYQAEEVRPLSFEQQVVQQWLESQN